MTTTTCLPGRASCAPIAMPMPWPTGASGPASTTCPGKRAVNHCVIQPDSVKESTMTRRVAAR